MAITGTSADDARWALQQITARAPAYKLARDYYDGRHRLAFATEKFRQAFAGLFHAFALNLTAPVVDAVHERVRIEGWGLTDGTDEAADGAPLEASALWSMDQLGMMASEVHREALVTGDGYVIVWPGLDGGPVWHPQVAEEMVCRYDPERPGRITFAAKAWVSAETGRARLTLYYPDRLERYATAGKVGAGLPEGIETFEPYADHQGAPVVPNPWGVVPVFHLPNRAGVGRRGSPEHVQAIPVQDALNKTVLDLIVGGEFQSLPQRWATGLELPTDANGEPVAPKAGPGRLWSYPDPEARFGQFEAADLRQLLEVKGDFSSDVARVTGTPLHRFMLVGDGNWPSGEALKTAEAPLVAKVETRTEVWGAVWGWAMGLALRMAQLPADRPLRPVWRSPASRSQLEDVTVAEAKVRLGVTREQALVELGYSREEAAAMVSASEEERARAVDRGAIL